MNICSKTLKSRFAKDAAALTLGTAFSQLLTLLTMPLLSRIYDTSDFGKFSLFLASATITSSLITLRYESMTVVPKDDATASHFVSLSFFSIVAITTILIPLSFMISTGFLKNSVFAEFSGVLPQIVLASAAMALTATAAAWLNRKKLYKKMSGIKIAQSIFFIPPAIFIGYSGGKSGLITSQLLSLVIVAIASIYFLYPLLKHIEIPAIFKAAKANLHIPAYLLPTTAVDVITQQLPLFLITVYLNSSSAGEFSMAWRILALPSALVGAALGQVFLQRFSAICDDVSAARKLLFKTWRTLFFAALLPAAAIMIFGKEIFSILLGSKWGGAGEIAQILTPMLFAMFISSPTSGIYLALGLQRFTLYFGISFLLYRTASIYFGIMFGNLKIALIIWTFFELGAIFIYNYIAVKKLGVK